MKTPVCSPNMLSLTRAMASSRSRNGKATTSGANASLEHTWAVSGTFGQDGRREERAVGPAAGEDRAAHRDRLVDPALGPAAWLRVDHRADVGRRVERVADLELRDAGEEPLHERVPDGLVDEHPLDADAHLAGVGERADEDCA